ncbi:MAG TPA: cation:proton antiporter [Polyangiaceae bacterium]|jgi:Kef-type K+ transport system membrane component KefB|nr:cation:proton antiporter [Polyangiaceae bacterium]
MSGHGGPKKTLATRAIQLVSLLVTFGVLYGVTKVAPELETHLGTVAAVGFLLLAGTLMSELLETIGLPHLSGYLLAGIVGGPDVLHLVDHHTVDELSPVNTLALSLIALAGGAELRVDTLRSVARGLAWATLLQSTTVLICVAGVFVAIAGYLPFTHGMAFKPLLGVALLWGVLAVSRSPSACMGILSQTRAKGPVATFSLAFIMLSDVVVVILLATMMMLARPLINGTGSISIDDFSVLGHEILASVAVGVTLGLGLAIYLRLVGRQLLLVLVAIGFGLSDTFNYIGVDSLLAFLSAGFVVTNLSDQGPKLLESIEQTGSVVFVVFFATAGAHLNIPLLKQMGPVAVALCASRALFTVIAGRISSRVAEDPAILKRWGWSSLVSQAGLALGLSVVISRAFPSFGEGFRSLTIAAVAINEMIGPVLFKFALDRAGETDIHEPEVRASLAPPA